MKAQHNFKLILSHNWLRTDDIFEQSSGKPKLVIVSDPVEIYSKWYWKILNFLTFNKYFNSGYKYTVKQLKI